MFSFKMILGSLAVAVISDLIAVKYYPQGGSRVGWTVNQLRGSLAKFRNVTHRCAELFCNNPDECKQATDEFFGILSDIPQDVIVRIMEFLGNATSAHKESYDSDHGAVQKNQDAAKKGAVDFTNGGEEVKGDEQKAEMIIKSLKFASYDENNLCDLKEGIPPEEYDVTVDEIADLTNMPEKLKKTIKRAKNFTGGNVLAVNRLQFKAADGNLVFGRVAVIRRGKVLDMAYSLHSVEYELMPKQRQPDNADKLKQFSGSFDQENGKSTAFDGISMELREDFLAFFHKQAYLLHSVECELMPKQRQPNNADKVEQFSGSLDQKNGKSTAFDGISMKLREDFLAFFHKQAIKGFVKHCDYVLKTITQGDDVVRALGVQSSDEPGEEKNI